VVGGVTAITIGVVMMRALEVSSTCPSSKWKDVVGELVISGVSGSRSVIKPDDNGRELEWKTLSPEVC